MKRGEAVKNLNVLHRILQTLEPPQQSLQQIGHGAVCPFLEASHVASRSVLMRMRAGNARTHVCDDAHRRAARSARHEKGIVFASAV